MPGITNAFRRLSGLVPAAVLVLMLGLAGCATPAPVGSEASAPARWAPQGRAADDPMFDFDGIWQGRVRMYNAPRFDDARGRSAYYQLAIHGQEVEVSFFDGGVWKRLKPGRFTMARWASQAVVTSITSGHDDDGLWVESATFVLVHDTPGTVLVYWTRAVNNLDVPQEADNAHFALGGSGRFELKTIPSSAAPDDDDEP